MTARGRGLRRFATDLPPVDEFVTLGEGDTPLLPLSILAEHLNVARLSAKMELLNPTGSYKDRVAAMSMSLARQRGAAGWIATSSGNAGLAMAAYGTRADIPGFLCMVAEAPLEKWQPLIPYAIAVVRVKGVGPGSTGRTGADLFDQVRATATRHNLYLGVTANALNPDGMWGIDTIGYELAEQAPDATHIYVPTGGGGLLASVARGLESRGVRARVIAAQPSGCAPIVRYVNGEIPTPEIDRCGSVISALQLPLPPDGELAADAVARSRGWGTAVSDDAIVAAQRLLALTEGIFVEPAGAAGLAAVIEDLDQGRLGRNDHPLLILSGAGWKDLSRFASDAEQVPHADVEELGAYVDRWATAIPRARGECARAGTSREGLR